MLSILYTSENNLYCRKIFFVSSDVKKDVGKTAATATGFTTEDGHLINGRQ